MAALYQEPMARALSERVGACVRWLDELGQSLVLGRPISKFSVSHLPAQAEGSGDAVMQQTIFAYSVAALAAKIMQADGAINAKESKAFLQLFQAEGIDRKRLSSLLLAASRDAAPLKQYAGQLAGFYESSPEMKRQLFLRLARVALADGYLQRVEYDALLEVGAALGVNAYEAARLVDRLYGEFSVQTADECRAVLAVSASAGQEEIASAYREKMRYFHPDRWSGVGRYQELYRLTNARSVQVNAAYRRLISS